LLLNTATYSRDGGSPLFVIPGKVCRQNNEAVTHGYVPPDRLWSRGAILSFRPECPALFLLRERSMKTAITSSFATRIASPTIMKIWLRQSSAIRKHDRLHSPITCIRINVLTTDSLRAPKVRTGKSIQKWVALPARRSNTVGGRTSPPAASCVTPTGRP